MWKLGFGAAIRAQGRPSTVRRWPHLIFLPFILSGCAAELEEPRTPGQSRAAIPHPPLDEMDRVVARELESRRAELDALLARDDLAPAERGGAIGQMGQVYHAHHLHGVAEACYRDAHALEPERFDWAYYLGVLLSLRGDP